MVGLDSGPPVVIGGMVLDIHAKPFTPATPGTTTPGLVQYVKGGVARNVAECMSKLGISPFMISVVGLDMAGDLLLKHWKSIGLCTEGIRKCHDIVTPVVSNIFDGNGELAAAVASVEAVIKFTSPNENELIAMANALSCGNTFSPIQRSDKEGIKLPIKSLFQLLKPAICLLLLKGVEVVVVTLGPDGVLLCSRERPPFIKGISKRPNLGIFGKKLYELMTSNCPSNRFVAYSGKRGSEPYVWHFPAVSASVVSLTGAGDCLVGGTLASTCAGLDIAQGMAVGIAVAKTAVETEINVPSEFSVTTIADDAKATYCAAEEIRSEPMDG